MYLSISFIQPIFHLKVKPRDPVPISPVTFGHAVDSSAMVTKPG